MLPALLVAICVVFRVVPHPPNVAPVGATAVFAGRTLRPWMALCLVTVAMFLGDVALARFRGYAVITPVTPFVYAGFFAQALLGRALCSKKGGTIGAAALGSMAFFILSNLGVWLFETTYAHTFPGFLACYVAAIPYYGRTLAGDVVWTVLLSVLYDRAAKRLESRRLWVPVSTREIAIV
jgi:hypothetical protein